MMQKVAFNTQYNSSKFVSCLFLIGSEWAHAVETGSTAEVSFRSLASTSSGSSPSSDSSAVSPRFGLDHHGCYIAWTLWNILKCFCNQLNGTFTQRSWGTNWFANAPNRPCLIGLSDQSSLRFPACRSTPGDNQRPNMDVTATGSEWDQGHIRWMWFKKTSGPRILSHRWTCRISDTTKGA